MAPEYLEILLENPGFFRCEIAVSFRCRVIHQLKSMVVSGSPKRWDRWHSPSPNWQEKYHLYTTYMYIAFVLDEAYLYIYHLYTTYIYHLYNPYLWMKPLDEHSLWRHHTFNLQDGLDIPELWQPRKQPKISGNPVCQFGVSTFKTSGMFNDS